MFRSLGDTLEISPAGVQKYLEAGLLGIVNLIVVAAGRATVQVVVANAGHEVCVIAIGNTLKTRVCGASMEHT